MNTAQRMAFFFTTLTAICLCLFLLSACRPKPKTDALKIALAAPLTGDLAAMGQGMKNAAELAIAQYRGAQTGGPEIELAAFDDRADPKEAVNAANQIVSGRLIIGVAGHLNSGCSIPASAVYHRHNLLMISPASTNPKLTRQGFPNIFRVCATDEAQGGFCADYLFTRLGMRKISCIHDQTAYGQGLVEEFSKRFRRLGGEISSLDAVNIGEKDYTALLTKIKSLKPQALFFGGVYTEGGLISRQARSLGLDCPLVGGDALKSPEYIDIAGGASEDDIVTMIGLSADKLPRAAKFMESYSRAYPRAKIQPYDAYTYDTVNMIIEAVRQSGPDKAKIIDYITRIKYSGVTGEISFDEKGDTTNKAISIYQIKDGDFKPLSD